MGVGATLLGGGSFPISRLIAFKPVAFQSVTFQQVILQTSKGADGYRPKPDDSVHVVKSRIGWSWQAWRRATARATS